VIKFLLAQLGKHDLISLVSSLGTHGIPNGWSTPSNSAHLAVLKAAQEKLWTAAGQSATFLLILINSDQVALEEQHRLWEQ
jgi:hypothetical protein